MAIARNREIQRLSTAIGEVEHLTVMARKLIEQKPLSQAEQKKLINIEGIIAELESAYQACGPGLLERKPLDYKVRLDLARVFTRFLQYQMVLGRMQNYIGRLKQIHEVAGVAPNAMLNNQIYMEVAQVLPNIKLRVLLQWVHEYALPITQSQQGYKAVLPVLFSQEISMSYDVPGWVQQSGLEMSIISIAPQPLSDIRESVPRISERNKVPRLSQVSGLFSRGRPVPRQANNAGPGVDGHLTPAPPCRKRKRG